MFSSIFSSIQSPKSLLAFKLANALSTYFDVDPKAIETNLVHDAKIVLYDIRLKPERVGTALLVGQVNEIEFSWKWGGSADGSTSFVRETVLSIRGVKGRLIANAATSSNATTTTTTTTTTPNSVSASGNKKNEQAASTQPGYLDRYIQQVIDHLTLNITDIEIVLETLDEKDGNIVFEGKSIQLLSLGRKESASSEEEPTPPLSQRLSVGSLSAHIALGAEKLPLLDSFAYATSVRRVSGRRFLNFTNGLELTGDIGNVGGDNHNITIHAKETQVTVLSQVLGEFLDVSRTLRDEIAAQQALDSEVDQAVGESDLGPSTVFVLPFPSLVLHLPNGSKVQMPNCTIRYHMDGYTLRLYGADGIRINDQETPLLQLADDATWSFDFTGNDFLVAAGKIDDAGRLSSTESITATIAQINWEENEMRQMIEGFFRIESLSRATTEKARQAYPAEKTSTSALPWSLAVNGVLALRLDGEKGEWVEGSIISPSFVLPSADDVPTDSFVSEFLMGGVQLCTSSFGNVAASIAPSSIKTSSNELCIHGSIQVGFESVDTLKKIHGFVSRASDFASVGSVEESPYRSNATLPLTFHIPSIRATISDPRQISVRLDNVSVGRDYSTQIESVKVEEKDGEIAGLLKGLLVNRHGDDWCASIKEISSFHFAGAFDLAEPILNSTINFIGGKLTVHMPSTLELRLLKLKNDNESTTGVTLPIPIQVVADEILLILPSISEDHRCFYFSLKEIDIGFHQIENGCFVANSHKPTALVAQGAEKQMNALLEPTSIIVSPDFSIIEARCQGLRIGPLSFGSLVVELPSFSMLSDKSAICFDGNALFCVDRLETLVSLQKFFDCIKNQIQDTVGSRRLDQNARVSSDNIKMIVPLPVYLAETRVTISELNSRLICCDLELVESTLRINSFFLEVSDRGKVQLHDIFCSFAEGYSVQVGKLSSLSLLDTLELSEPCEGPKIHLQNDVLAMALPEFECILDVRKTPPAPSSFSGGTENKPSFELPFMVNISMKKSTFRTRNDLQTRITTSPFNISGSTVDRSISFATDESVQVRFESTPTDWLEIQVGTTSANFGEEIQRMKSISCTSIHVGPCSYGEVSFDAPNVLIDMVSSKVDISGTIRGTILSTDLVASIHHLGLKYSLLFTPLQEQSESSSFALQVTEVAFDVLERNAHANVTGILADSTSFQCKHMRFCGADGLSLAVSGLNARLNASIWTATIDFVEALHVPEVLSLKQPIKSIALSFSEGHGLFVDMATVHAVLLDSEKPSRPPNSETVNLPFPIRWCLKDLYIEIDPRTQDFLRGGDIDAKLEPKSDRGMGFCVPAKLIENRMGKVHNAVVSGTYRGSNAVFGLQAKVESATVSAGFSSVEWSNMLRKRKGSENKTVWNLPFAQIAPFAVHVTYEGKVLSTDNVLRIKQFHGDTSTTSTDIEKHLTNETVRQMPGFFSGAELLGESVIDLSAKSVGRAALSKSLTGSVTGSIGGLVVSDSIRGAIASGKQARGAASDERYHFGDVTRGALRAVKKTTTVGGSLRREGNDSAEYHVGDFSKGASVAMGKYTSENKSRIAAAGGSSIGMAIGMAALGPVGLVAGSIAGARAGARAFSGDKSKVSDVNEEAPGQLHSQNTEQSNEEDLLGLDPSTFTASPSQTDSTAHPFASHPQLQQIPECPAPTARSYVDPFIPQPVHQMPTGQSRTDPFVHEPQTRAPISSIATASPVTAQMDMNSSFNPSSRVQDPFDLMNQASSLPQQQQQQQRYSNSQQEYPVAMNDSSNQHSFNHTNTTQNPQNGMFNPTAHASAQTSYLHQQPQPPQAQSYYQPPPHQSNYQYPEPQRQQSSHQPPPQQLHGYSAAASQSREQQEQQAQAGYRFGDVTRSIISKGKKKGGRSENSSYKFGDFTRGLFGS